MTLKWLFCLLSIMKVAAGVIMSSVTFRTESLVMIRGGVLEDVLGLEDVLEDTFWSPWPWPWPRSVRSLKIALSSARGQHYFLTRWNFVGKRQKHRENFANTFFVFRNWSIGVAKRASPQLKFYQWQKCDKKAYCFFSFSFFLAFFAYTSSEQQYWRPGAPGPPQINFCQPIVNLEEMDSFRPKSCYLRITSSLFMNVMH